MRPRAITIVNSNLSEITRYLLKASQENSGVSVRLVNTYSLSLAIFDKNYRKLLRQPAINLPDGKPLEISGRLLQIGKEDKPSQIRGVDLLRSMARNPMHEKVMFIGSTDAVLASLKIKMGQLNPSLESAIFINPGKVSMDDSSLRELREAISNFQPYFVWISLGTPLQDFVTTKLAHEFTGVFLGVGAAFDFMAENHKEASVTLQKLGLEWLHRFLSEPKRLWSRYLLMSPLGALICLTPLIKWRRTS